MRPRQAAFYDPSARQGHEASFGHGALDGFKPDAVLLGSISGVRSGLAPVDVSQLDRAAADLLDLFGMGAT